MLCQAQQIVVILLWVVLHMFHMLCFDRVDWPVFAMPCQRHAPKLVLMPCAATESSRQLRFIGRAYTHASAKGTSLRFPQHNVSPCSGMFLAAMGSSVWTRPGVLKFVVCVCVCAPFGRLSCPLSRVSARVSALLCCCS